MIDRNGSMFILTCDICAEEVVDDFDDFQDAVDYKKENGWKSQRRNGEWEDICPICRESERRRPG